MRTLPLGWTLMAVPDGLHDAALIEFIPRTIALPPGKVCVVKKSSEGPKLEGTTL